MATKLRSELRASCIFGVAVIGIFLLGGYDVFVISRGTTFGRAPQAYVDAVGDYVAAGGNIVTEWSGGNMFFSSYAADIRPPADQCPQLSIFDGAIHSGWSHAANTPINLLDPLHPTVAGLPNPLMEGTGTEFFFWLESADPDITILADFVGNGSVGFPQDQDLPCLAVGCDGNLTYVFGMWCWNDTLSQNAYNAQFFVQAVEDPEPYQHFFRSLEQALFVESQLLQ